MAPPFDNDTMHIVPQSLANLLTHLVFSTAHRDPYLTGDVRAELHPYITGILRNKVCPLVQIGSVEDHVHILFSLSRTESLSEVVKAVKGSSSVWIKGKWPKLREFGWQAGYGAFSVGQSELAATVQYIQKQEEHHRKVSFQDEYRELLKLAGLEVDERYAWD